MCMDVSARNISLANHRQKIWVSAVAIDTSAVGYLDSMYILSDY